jgi:hypothetical protein
MKRRDFLKTAMLAGASLFLCKKKVDVKPKQTPEDKAVFDEVHRMLDIIGRPPDEITFNDDTFTYTWKANPFIPRAGLYFNALGDDDQVPT